MRTSVVQMTPKKAEALLRKNTRNRPIIKRRVETLVDAIESGQWKLTHQGVAVGPDGTIDDGQHRLTAIARAGITVPILVTHLDGDVFDVIDTGRPRGAADTLRLAGVTNAAVLPPAIRQISHYRSDARDSVMGSHHAKLTNTDQLIRLEEWPELTTWARRAEHTADLIGRRGLRTPLLAAMVVIAQDAPDLGDTQSEFFSKLGEPIMLAATSPIIALRRWMVLTMPALKASSTAQYGMYATIRAWNAYVQGESWAKVNVQIGRPGSAPDVSCARSETADELDSAAHG